MPTIVSYDGHAINDGAIYRAFMPEDAFDPAQGSPQSADVNFWYPQFVSNKKQAKDQITLYVEVLGTPTSGQFQARHDEIDGWFNTQDGAEQYLVATFADGTTRRLACRPIYVKWTWTQCVITLKAHRPLWENNTLSTEAWVATDSNLTKALTVGGNVNVAPTFRIQLTNTPLNGYRWKRPVIVRNRIGSRLLNYPLEITGDGDWDTAALVKNASKTTTLFTSPDEDDTTIYVDSTALFYAAGWIVIDDEQIYYGSKDSGALYDCMRGVNGTTAAAHTSSTTIYQSEMAADGSDIAIEIDGVDVERWFGADPGEAGGPNSTNTKVWVNFPDIPAKPTTDYDSVYVTYGAELGQLYGTATASSQKSDGGGAASVLTVEGVSNPLNYRWQANGVVPQWVQVDLGEQRLVNTIKLWLWKDTDNCPKNFEIRATNDQTWATYAVIKSVVNVPSPGGSKEFWVTYTFTTDENGDPIEAYRYWRIYITAMYYNNPPIIVRFRLYNSAANTFVKYGNPAVTNAEGPLARQPMFDLADSLNSKWVYSEFYDHDYTSRPQQWSPVLLGTSKQEQRVYNISGGVEGDEEDQVYSGNPEGYYSGGVYVNEYGGAGMVFTAGMSGVLTRVQLGVGPTGDVNPTTCEIYSLVGGTYSLLGAIGNAIFIDSTGSASWLDFVPTSEQPTISLVAGNQYMIRPRCLFQTTNGPHWLHDSYQPDYSGGYAVYWDGDSWEVYPGTVDYWFRTYVLAGRSNILGVATKTLDTTQFLNAWSFSHPCGISQVIYSGNTKQNPTYRRLDLIGVDANNNRKTIHSVTTDTHTAWGGFGPLTYPLSPAAISIYFAHTWLASTTAENYGEVTDAELTISVPPTVEFQEPQETSSVKFTLKNQTTGQSILVEGLLPLNTALDLDCEAHLVSEALSGVEHASFVSADAVRDFWLELAPGANTLELVDEAVTGLSIETRYRARWI